MSAFFLVLLAASLGGFILSSKMSQEIFQILAGGAGTVCLIGGFAMAPWQVQLALVITIIYWERLSPFKGVGSSK